MKTLFLILALCCATFGQAKNVKKQNSAPVKQTIKKSVTDFKTTKPEPVESADKCDAYTVESYDKISGRTGVYGTQKLVVSSDGKKSGFVIRFYNNTDSTIVSMDVVGGGSCMADKGDIKFLFTDSSRLTLTDIAGFNCDGHAFFVLGAKPYYDPDAFEQLATKKIEAMRVSTYKSFVQGDFTNFEAIIFKNQIDCLRKKLPKAAGDNDKAISTLPPNTQEKLAEIPPRKANVLTVQDDTSLNVTKPTPPPAPKTISGGVLNGKVGSIPQPEYPPEAKKARAGGTVTVQVEIDTKGDVISAKAVSGHPLLKEAAEKAALKAKFKPTTLSGQTVNVTGVLTYNFIR